MTVLEWLDQGAMMNEIIEAKLAEREQLLSLATKVTANNDGMPHSSGVSDKVGNIAVKMAALSAEIDALIDKYVDYKQQVNKALQKLPANQYGVLHRRYVLQMSWDEIAYDMSYSRMQIWRIHNSGLKGLKSIVKVGKKS